MKRVQVTMTITADVPDSYDEHDVADAVKFHLNLSTLDSIEADISTIRLVSAQEASQ